MDDIPTVENFFGVYLLYCLNTKYLGRTYIGYTVDPNRRIKQHNKGKQAGGAWRTSKRGPWSMVMIIHGFPNDISALRFEWAWQHPQRSRRIQHVAKKKAKEKQFDYCVRVLAEMLKTPPWCRLPLTIRWLNQEFARDFPADKTPPMHMPICYGTVISKKLNNTQKATKKDALDFCVICETIIETTTRKMSCLNGKCSLVAHVLCLSQFFLKDTKREYVPIEGRCPECDVELLWGDLVRKMKGCYDSCDVKIDVQDFSCSDGDDSD